MAFRDSRSLGRIDHGQPRRRAQEEARERRKKHELRLIAKWEAEAAAPPAGVPAARAAPGRGRLTIWRAHAAAPMKPASLPSWAKRISVRSAGTGKASRATWWRMRVQERLARGGHAAAEDDDVRVEDVHHVHGADGEVVRRLLDDPSGQLVPGVGRGEDLARVSSPSAAASASRSRGRPGSASSASRARLTTGGGAGVGLQAALGGRSRRAAGSVISILHVAEFAAVAVSALEHLVAEDDAAADAGAEREQHHARGLVGRPRPRIRRTPRRWRRSGRRSACRTCRRRVAHRHVPPRLQVQRVEDEAGGDVHQCPAWRRRWRRCRPATSGGGDGLADRLAHPCPGRIPGRGTTRSAG